MFSGSVLADVQVIFLIILFLTRTFDMKSSLESNVTLAKCLSHACGYIEEDSLTNRQPASHFVSQKILLPNASFDL